MLGAFLVLHYGVEEGLWEANGLGLLLSKPLYWASFPLAPTVRSVQEVAGSES